MRTTTTRLLAGLAATAVLGLAAGCGSDDSDAADDTATTSPESSATTEPDPAANLVGTGCSAYAEQVPTGPGSVDGMAQDMVTTAASNNPMLTTLTAAVTGQLNPDVNLVDTLESDEFTVFAPVDDAFAQLDQKTLDTLAKPAGAETLEAVLTYHVVPGQLAPDEVAGTHTTANGADVTVSGEGDALMVDDAAVICGGVQTQNATVYLIDGVLMPPS
ncbi:putative surface protein with fasciclin (FAS1) repeats [Mumia flava]|uniref:Putative surface protein with fasciclin (FAS1) repeats n=1 Tax=Mumia flava TaxID=1348852 RepID=A0A0B2BB91_9ACTN|nr:fasciclin domain-containing protein [Mumia flava]PJJ53949.1 putative surface protein with fasciclin (FAS1) repeats [Mumia flava]